jgi:flagellar hook protein FlgE
VELSNEFTVDIESYFPVGRYNPHMIRGLSTAASGLTADERLQQLLSNNLANIETPGFKASAGETLSFPEQLLQMINYNGTGGTSIGTLGTGTGFQEGVPMFTEGDMQQTGRNLDVAIVDNTVPGTYIAVGGSANSPVSSTLGSLTPSGPNGRLQVNGQDASVVNGSGDAVAGAYAIRNPKYTGTALYAEGGRADFDAAGQPSYLLVNQQNAVIAVPGQLQASGMSLRVGNESTMGTHSFYPVEYVSPQDTAHPGLALTRGGSLQVGAGNVLTDSAGHAILPVGSGGLPILGGRIVMNPKYTGATLFQADGTAAKDNKGNASFFAIDAAGQPISGRLGTVNADISQVAPLGASEFEVGGTLNAAQALAALQAGTGQLKPGSLEGSNVDPTVTMTQMINVVNQYQANQSVIETESGVLQEAVSDVGKVNA